MSDETGIHLGCAVIGLAAQRFVVESSVINENNQRIVHLHPADWDGDMVKLCEGRKALVLMKLDVRSASAFDAFAVGDEFLLTFERIEKATMP